MKQIIDEICVQKYSVNIIVFLITILTVFELICIHVQFSKYVNEVQVTLMLELNISKYSLMECTLLNSMGANKMGVWSLTFSNNQNGRHLIFV